MVQHCCVVLCHNKAVPGTKLSFHKFPFKEPECFTKWLARISRKNEDGTDWKPTQNDKVCSEHFVDSDYYKGLDKRVLREDAIPSVFQHYPAHKNVQTPKRPSPKKRTIQCDFASKPKKSCTETLQNDHSYNHASVEDHLQKTQEKLNAVQMKQNSAAADLKNIKRKLVRRDRKIEGLLSELKDQQVLQQEQIDLLGQNFDSATFTLIENELKATVSSKFKMDYSEDLKSFAVTLHYYSAQAYDFVRKHLHLPHPDTIRRWASSYNTEPGFLADAIEGLRKKLENDSNMQDVCLVFDAMSLRQQVLYDQKQQRMVGYVNHGHLQIAAPDSKASESLTFLIVGLKKFFKEPIGYFLIDKIGAKQQAELVKDAVALLTEAGFIVRAVTCDGAYTNQATSTHLGCSLQPDNVKTDVQHPTKPEETIHFIFDACHLIKNVRNCFGDKGILYSDGEAIKWGYVVQLHKLQCQDNLHLSNKIRGAHLDYMKNKMNVSMAVQTLSSSVATAIDHLRDDLHLPQFAGSEATCAFLRWFDKIFDFCNSSNYLAKGFKRPITQHNFEAKAVLVEKACQYIYSLTDATGQPLVRCKRKTGFIGFIATMKSLLSVSRLLLSQGYKYILTYRFSQDHIEMLFSRIRRHGGWNNNPNVLQFQYALCALLLKNGVLASSRGNCLPLSTPDDTICSTEPDDGSQSDEDDVQGIPVDQMARIISSPGPYHENALFYISGFVCRKLMKKIKCTRCAEFVASHSAEAQTISSESACFTKRRDNGGLLYATSDIFTVVVKTDKVLRRLLASSTKGPMRSVSKAIIAKVTLEVIAALREHLFKDLADHAKDCHFESEADHATLIMKDICSIFCNIILHHHAKLYTQRFIRKNKGSVRHHLNKTVIFLHQ